MALLAIVDITRAEKVWERSLDNMSYHNFVELGNTASAKDECTVVASPPAVLGGSSTRGDSQLPRQSSTALPLLS